MEHDADWDKTMNTLENLGMVSIANAYILNAIKRN
jgi:hypothetical protein